MHWTAFPAVQAMPRDRRDHVGEIGMSGTDASAERLWIAQDLISARTLDVTAALTLLNTLPETLGPSVLDAVTHAKRAVAAAPGGDHRHQAVARYMVARVLALLEAAHREREAALADGAFGTAAEVSR